MQSLLLQGILSGLGSILETKSTLKMMKNCFLYHLKSPFLSQDIYFFVLTLGHVEKLSNRKKKVNFKIDDVATWLRNNCNIHIGQYLKNQRCPFRKFDTYSKKNENDETQQKTLKIMWILRKKILLHSLFRTHLTDLWCSNRPFSW